MVQKQIEELRRTGVQFQRTASFDIVRDIVHVLRVVTEWSQLGELERRGVGQGL